MGRTNVTVTVDEELLLLVTHLAQIHGERIGESLEYAIYRDLRQQVEEVPAGWDLPALDDLYGRIHQHWEDEGRSARNALHLPF